jgi:hypothetical protein
VFLTIVPQRNAETLEAVITRFVKPGSKIYTDCWRGYGGLSSIENQNYNHFTVNHEMEYITENGVNTNAIEGNNNFSS